MDSDMQGKVLSWGKWIVAHGVAWALASKLGFEAVKADTLGAQVAEAVIALGLIAWSIYDSYRGRQNVKASE